MLSNFISHRILFPLGYLRNGVEKRKGESMVSTKDRIAVYQRSVLKSSVQFTSSPFISEKHDECIHGWFESPVRIISITSTYSLFFSLGLVEKETDCQTKIDEVFYRNVDSISSDSTSRFRHCWQM